jgi:hypothetical protein
MALESRIRHAHERTRLTERELIRMSKQLWVLLKAL